MFVHVISRSLSAFSRWSRDRVQHHLLKIKRINLVRLFIYTFILFIFISYALLFQVHNINSINNVRPRSKEAQDSEDHDRSDRGDAKLTTPRKFAPVGRIVNPHNYHMMMSNPKICGHFSQEMNLLIFVASAADHFERRKSIRETWGQKSHLDAVGAKLVFLLANPNSLKIQREVVEEYRTNGDIMQEDFYDSYLNLTLKTVMGIKWAYKHCQQTHFVMKTDDDIFVNVPLLLKNIEPLKGRRIFTGCIKQLKSFQPVNLSPGVQLPPGHPPFVAGAGYVFSGSLLGELYEASLRKEIVPIEDVYVTAHLAKMVHAHPPIHDQRFSCGEMVTRDCHLSSTFTGHRISPERMRTIWHKLRDSSNPCSSRG